MPAVADVLRAERGFTISWLTVRSLVLALTLAFFCLSPAAEGFVCAADDLAVPVASASADSALTPAPADHGSEKSACPHGGHCHQTSMTELRVARFTPLRHVRAAPHVVVDVLAPASRAAESLERPPRA